MNLPVIVINSHPIQYFSPLYEYCASNGLDLEVWYLSNESLKGAVDKQFGVQVKWNIPLLSGYKHKFLKNHSFRPSIYKGFFGLINLGLARSLFTAKKSLVIIHGWNFFAYIYAFFWAKIFGHKVALRCESPINQEITKSKIIKGIKRILLAHLIFRGIDFFLFIGEQNRLFYKFYSVKEEKLIFSPYSVDNKRFQREMFQRKDAKKELKRNLKIHDTDIVIIFSGKYISKKRPLLLLDAYANLKQANKALIMIGEGDLRVEMQNYIKEKNLQNVVLTGFVNQAEISDFYSIGDIFVLCSESGETWGLVVNEAMNFELPVIVSSIAGSSRDLVRSGENGFVFDPTVKGDLLSKLIAMMDMDNDVRRRMGIESKKIVDSYSYQEVLDSFFIASKI